MAEKLLLGLSLSLSLSLTHTRTLLLLSAKKAGKEGGLVGWLESKSKSEGKGKDVTW